MAAVVQQVEMTKEDLEDEIAAFKQSGTLIRTQAPVLLQWPWQNGIALEHGSMRGRLEKSLAGSSRDHRLVDMVTVSEEYLSYPSP
jgi:hypothetical protein